MKKLIIIIFVFISWPAFSGNNTPLQGYSAAPLKDPVFDYVHVIVDVAKFNNWLNANYPKMTAETMKGPREHLYFLIGSYVSELYKKDRVILPKEHDLILQILFSWSEKLGVFGGSLVYNQIKSEKFKPMTARMKIPGMFELSLKNDLYLMAATSNAWSVKFPYYFMIGNMKVFQATNGMQTQLVVISTGASKDSTKAGRSQATLMFIYAPFGNYKLFSEYWLSQLEITPDIRPTGLGVRSLKSRIVYDKTSLLHKEITFWPSKNGSFAVVYLGMDGTYQANRQHFLDFLNQIEISQ